MNTKEIREAAAWAKLCSDQADCAEKAGMAQSVEQAFHARQVLSDKLDPATVLALCDAADELEYVQQCTERMRELRDEVTADDDPERFAAFNMCINLIERVAAG